MEDLMLEMADVLEAKISSIKAKGISSSWVGKMGSLTYLFWMEGGKQRSRRIRGAEIAEAQARYKRYCQCQWLEGRIAEMHRAKPRRCVQKRLAIS